MTRLDTSLKEDELNQFAKNLRSLSETQASLAKQYAEWAAEGGKRAEQYAKEAIRLTDESIKYAALAEREMNR